MKRLIVIICLLYFTPGTNGLFGQAATRYLNNQSADYKEVIAFYTEMAAKYDQATLMTYDRTDVGRPLNLFIISADGDFNPVSLRKKKKRVLLINNAIHPGEPCGVDASIKLTIELLEDENLKSRIGNLVICIVPMYNIGGALNRGCCSRVNQNGPAEYGFRGNAKNLDLNRDFIKADSRNTKGFTTLFHQWDPDVFIDTHTSNGADYQYVMTLITTQLDKLHPSLAGYVKDKMGPALYKSMKKSNYEMTPYVNSMWRTPESGIAGFLETPRYSTGYAALFHTIGFTTEAHMFKPFKDRVLGTYYFLNSVMEFMQSNYEEIGNIRAKAKELSLTQRQFDIDWNLDTTKYELITFKGYKAHTKESKVSGKDRLYYDRNQPYTKKIKYYNRFNASITVSKPAMYIIPQGWDDVIERLRMNGVILSPIMKDTLLEVEIYFIESYKSTDRPYEGHYLHREVTVSSKVRKMQYYQGDYIIETNQTCNRYIVESLEPQGVDSYFAWNFFDPILQQKEWFSSYVFEDKAEEILKEYPGIKKELDQKVASDTSFSNSGRAQLRYIYERSPYYEKSRNRYPVTRIMNATLVPLR